MANVRTISDSAEKVASGLASGTLSVGDALGQLAALFRESLRVLERIEGDMQHLRSICHK
jgi:hypothetical protein